MLHVKALATQKSTHIVADSVENLLYSVDSQKFNDAHVPIEHAQKLAQAMRSLGNNKVTVKIVKDYNHLFLLLGYRS